MLRNPARKNVYLSKPVVIVHLQNFQEHTESFFGGEWEWEWTISSDSMHVCLHQLHPIRSTQGWRGLCPEWSSTASGGHIYVMINGYSISLYDETLHGTKDMSATDATYVLSKH